MGKSLALAIALGLLVSIVNIALTLFVVLRRVRRSHYFALKDKVRHQLTGTVSQAGLGARHAVLALKAYSEPAARDAIEELLLAAITSTTHQAVTDVMVELGYVARWAKRAFSLRQERGGPLARVADVICRSRVFAVRRAIAVGHLGYLHGSIAAPLMIQALRDPSPLVISVAADSLARTGSTTGLIPLLDLLRRTIDDNTVAPERGAKAALVTLRPDVAILANSYSAAQPKRFRMAVLDVLHELHRASNFKQRLSNRSLVEALRDPDCEIRARAVRLIPMLDVDSEAVKCALEDEAALVRLRATRISSRVNAEAFTNIHDEQWRVREAAVAALSGSTGRDRQHLLDELLTTDDRYAAEQIMEHWQLTGELRACIARLNHEDAFGAELVCRKAVELRMDSMVIEALQPHTPEGVLVKLLGVTHDSSHPSRASRLVLLAECSSEKVSAIARQQLQGVEGIRSEVVGAA